jgi:REP element-mobilizing transposase RayT
LIVRSLFQKHAGVPLRPLNHSKELTRFRGNLPHWRQKGVTYFVTFRLADSLPAGKITEWREQRTAWFSALNLESDANINALPLPVQREYHQRFTASILRWLDTGFGSCRLRRRDAAQVVAEALWYFDGDRYALGAWVVMPNHVHVLVTPFGNVALGKIVQSWKSFTAKAINRLDGKSGAFWQSEFYDHVIRDEEQLRKLEDYIAQNPEKAHLRRQEYLLGGSRCECVSGDGKTVIGIKDP